MTIDSLRMRIVLVWLGTAVLGYVAIAVSGIVHVRGITFAEVGPTAKNFTEAVLPTLLALAGLYFAESDHELKLTPGQQIVAQSLTYIYLSAALVVLFGTLWLKGILLDQKCTNHFEWIAPWQPLVSAPLFFIFGKGSGRVS